MRIILAVFVVAPRIQFLLSWPEFDGLRWNSPKIEFTAKVKRPSYMQIIMEIMEWHTGFEHFWLQIHKLFAKH